MGAPIQWGDVGTWLGTGAGIAGLLRGLGNRQQVQFQGWADMLGGLTDLEPEELRRTVEDYPVIAEILAIAGEEAARTASDEKRYLLAQVVAAALRGDATPGQVDALLYLARTVVVLDPADITLLVIIGTTPDGEARPTEEFPVKGEDEQMEDTYTRTVDVRNKELVDRWPAPRALLNPALASLEQAGVIEQRKAYLGGGAATWALSGYGEMFLDHLLTDWAAGHPAANAKPFGWMSGSTPGMPGRLSGRWVG
jgi:hypothetical protein